MAGGDQPGVVTWLRGASRGISVARQGRAGQGGEAEAEEGLGWVAVLKASVLPLHSSLRTLTYRNIVPHARVSNKAAASELTRGFP